MSTNHKKIIFLAGGAGYVGSKFMELALKKNYQVICYDKLVYGKKSLASFYKKKKFKFFEGDIRDEKSLSSIFKKNKISYVVNLASIVGDKQCNTIPKSAYDINYNGNKILYRVSEAYSKNIKKFIYASTCSNYGIVNPNEYVNENSVLKPVSLYAETKVDCENFLKKKTNKIPTVVLRFATAYGLSHRTRFDLTINSFTYESIKYKKLDIFSPDTWRPFVHVDDMADIMLRSIEIKNKKKYLLYNAGYTANNFSKQQIVSKITDILKKNNKKVTVDYINTIIDRRDYRVNCNKIEKDFKLNKCISIDRAINDLIMAITKKKIAEKDIQANLLDQNCQRLKSFFKN